MNSFQGCCSYFKCQRANIKNIILEFGCYQNWQEADERLNALTALRRMSALFCVWNRFLHRLVFLKPV